MGKEKETQGFQIKRNFDVNVCMTCYVLAIFACKENANITVATSSEFDLQQYR